ncbi:BON domain-containing protein [Bdellovibrio reynosensis]|uniref:BON domain-containing protein n=1 Tax=Bdellovibrio reynosensis TaxID=2835041 RepID=A0ABY4CGB1_9BACT|nr:BON domain-containing protein [Bdellovibrio reynosensis]UOF02912.1 BON domain-containing protein [Bdellovibrio reynosensis]
MNQDDYYYSPNDPDESYQRYERTYDGSLRFAGDRGGLRNFAGKGPKNYQRSDERIYEEICEILTLDPDVDASDIEVKVRNGEVTLSGTTETKSLGRYVENSIEHITGIKNILNRIKATEQDPDRSRISHSLR